MVYIRLVDFQMHSNPRSKRLLVIYDVLYICEP